MGDIWENGLSTRYFLNWIKLGVVTYKPDENGNATGERGRINIADSSSLLKGSEFSSDGLVKFDYQEWDQPKYHERLKESYYIMKETFEEI